MIVLSNFRAEFLFFALFLCSIEFLLPLQARKEKIPFRLLNASFVL